MWQLLRGPCGRLLRRRGRRQFRALIPWQAADAPDAATLSAADAAASHAIAGNEKPWPHVLLLLRWLLLLLLRLLRLLALLHKLVGQG